MTKTEMRKLWNCQIPFIRKICSSYSRRLRNVYTEDDLHHEAFLILLGLEQRNDIQKPEHFFRSSLKARFIDLWRTSPNAQSKLISENVTEEDVDPIIAISSLEDGFDFSSLVEPVMESLSSREIQIVEALRSDPSQRSEVGWEISAQNQRIMSRLEEIGSNIEEAKAVLIRVFAIVRELLEDFPISTCLNADSIWNFLKFPENSRTFKGNLVESSDFTTYGLNYILSESEDGLGFTIFDRNEEANPYRNGTIIWAICETIKALHSGKEFDTIDITSLTMKKLVEMGHSIPSYLKTYISAAMNSLENKTNFIQKKGRGKWVRK